MRQIASMRNTAGAPNLILNGSFDAAPSFVAQTAASLTWIDGTATGSTAVSAYGWGCISGSGAGPNAAASFDSTTSRTGTTSMKLSTLNSSGAITIGNYRNLTVREIYIILLPNTQYIAEGYIKTNNVLSPGAFFDIRELTSALATVATNSTTKVIGTQPFTFISKTFTTGVTTAYASILLRNNNTGNTSDAWFDDLSLTVVTPQLRTTAGTRTQAGTRTLVT